MTDRTPDDRRTGDAFPDDDLAVDLDELRSLGFDVLGGEAPFGGMDDVRARAARVDRRRRWTLGAAAAAIVLVVAGIGVALAAVGEETAPDVATQPGALEGNAFLLPPEGATDVSVILGWVDPGREPGDGSDGPVPLGAMYRYRFLYTATDGSRLDLIVDRDVDGGRPVATVIEQESDGDTPSTIVIDGTSHLPTRSLRMACSEEMSAAGGPIDDQWRFLLNAPPPDAGCGPEQLSTGLERWVDELRAVGLAEWQQYVLEHGGREVYEIPPTSPTVSLDVTEIEFDEPPYERGVIEGVRYPYALHTHCGIRFARIDGRWWETTPLGTTVPPPGWDNPIEVGSVLLGRDVAVFTRDDGLELSFIPADEEPPGCQ